MIEERLYIGDELYLAIETVAAIYRVEVIWLEEVVASGLLEGGVASQPRVAIAAARLDRVATIVRLHRVLGLDLDTIEFALGA